MKFFVQAPGLTMWDTDVNKTDPCGTRRSTQILREHVPVRKSRMQQDRFESLSPSHPLHTIIKVSAWPVALLANPGFPLGARAVGSRRPAELAAPASPCRGATAQTGSEELPSPPPCPRRPFPEARGSDPGATSRISHLPSRPQLFRRYQRVGGAPGASESLLEALTHGRPARRCPAAPQGGSWRCGCAPACRAVAQVALRRL